MGMREKLLNLIGRVQDEGLDYSDVVCVYRTSNERLADYLIAHGVTIPVRCKDCKKRYDPNECPMCILAYGEQHDFTLENGYCDCGERRTDDG